MNCPSKTSSAIAAKDVTTDIPSKKGHREFPKRKNVSRSSYIWKGWDSEHRSRFKGQSGQHNELDQAVCKEVGDVKIALQAYRH